MNTGANEPSPKFAGSRSAATSPDKVRSPEFREQALDTLLTRDRRNDPVGRRILLAAASLWCFLVAWPVTFVEFAGVPVLLWSAWRLRHGKAYIPGLCREPLLLAVIAFGAVQFASYFWTSDRAQWLEQAGQMRWIWAMIILWPLADRRRTLWTALTLGFLLGNLTQLSHIAHVEFGLPTPTWDRAPDRYSGWWKPVVGGSVLVAMLGGHLAVLAARLSRVRAAPYALVRDAEASVSDRRIVVLALVGSVASLGGIVATGTRGAWLSAAGLVIIWLLAIVAILVRAKHAPTAAPVASPAGADSDAPPAPVRRVPDRRIVLAVTSLIAIAAAGVFAWNSLGDSVLRRVALARQEVAAAIEQRDYASDTGARIGMAIWSGQLFREHPFIGVGAGGFRPAVHAMLAAQGTPAHSVSVHDHAHNGLLHVAATSGLLGLVPALAVIALSLRGAMRAWRAAASVRPDDDRANPSIALAAPLGAIAGLLLVSAFDPVHLNAQSAALLATVLALTMPADRDASGPRSSSPP